MNPYYSPADYGLEIVAEVDTDEAYQFDMVVVWRDGEGRLWAAHDSGCSCPTPFEDVRSTADMTPVSAVENVRALLGEMSSYGSPNATAIFDFLAKVRAAVTSETRP